MKKLLSALMVFCLLLTMVPMSVWAETVAKPQKGFELNVPVRVNPVYASTVDPQQLEEELDALSSAPVFLSSGYVTETEAAAQLREQMTRRVNNIVVKVKTTNNNANEVFNGIFDRALEHTGQPTEGDYLAWQYGGAGVGSGYDYDWDGQFCYYTLPYQITYYSTAAQEAELDAAIAKLLSQWNTAGKSDYEKVSMINDYITETVYYDDANLNDPGYKLKYTAYAAMIHKTAVCQGYANLFYRLALSLDVDCRIVVGWGYSGSSWGNHAWNLVEIDGTYYYSDSTWDASWAQAGWSYPWFLLGSENMGKDHEADPEYAAFLANYNISKTDYAPGEPSPDPEPTPEWPMTGTCGNNVTWTLTQDGELTLSGTGSTWNYPEEYPGWHGYEDIIHSCVIEEGVTAIGDYLFYECMALDDIDIPDSVTSFGYAAFAFCYSLNNVKIPNSVTDIDIGAFYDCIDLTDVYYDGSAAQWAQISIGADNDYLLTATIHYTDPTPGPEPKPDPTCGISQDEVYAAIIALKNDYPEGMPWDNSNSYRWNINNTIGYGCAGFAFLLSDAAFGHLPSRTIYNDITIDDLRVGDILRQYNDTHSVVVLEVHDDYVVLAEGNFNSSIHWGRTLTAAEVAADSTYLITRYPEHTFVDGVCTECGAQEGQGTPDPTPEWPKTGACGNNMTWTLTEDGVLTLSGTGSTWDYADFDPGWYDYRDQINKCVIEEGVTRIGNFALFNCTAITSVEIPNSVTSFGEGAFAYCTGLSSLVIPDSVTHIGRAAFYSCTRLTSITIPNSVTFMGADIFSYCENLTSVKLPDNITALNANLFGCCYSLTNVTIPDSVTFIDEGVFYACESLTSIEIPEGVSAISAELFLQCCNLTTVTIPSSVTSIGEGAFAFCDRLTDIYFGGSEAQWAKIGIGERNEGLANATIHCAKSDPEPEPEPTPEWPKTGDCGNNVTWSLTEDGVLTLSGTGPTWDYPEDYPGWYDYRDQINKCIIEEGVTTIGDFVLFNCPAMTSVEIPNSVISFGEGAFGYCENLTNVEIPDSVTIIGPGAFAYCRNLTNVEIPDSVTIIDDAAFFDCRNMTSVEIPDSVTYIGVEAFSYCTSLTSVEIPNGLTRVSPYAFAGCSYLTTVTIPSSVTHIDEYAFSNCNSLKDIYYEGTAEQWAQVRIDGTNTRLLYVNFHFVVATHMPGDINGDGKVNSRDATRLFQYLAEWDVAVNEAALDVNGDGKVNSRDATRLFQYLAGWDVEIY